MKSLLFVHLQAILWRQTDDGFIFKLSGQLFAYSFFKNAKRLRNWWWWYSSDKRYLVSIFNIILFYLIGRKMLKDYKFDYYNEFDESGIVCLEGI